MIHRLVVFGLALWLGIGMTPALAEQLKMKWSGWSRTDVAVDNDGDGEPGLVSQQTGTGTLGPAVSTGIAENAAWDGQSFCAYNDEGVAEGILLTSIATTNVIRTATGDLLYSKLASSPPSTVCFNFVTSVAQVESYLDIIGGTGRYKGASGTSVRRLRVDVMNGINGAKGQERGQIYLTSGGKRKGQLKDRR